MPIQKIVDFFLKEVVRYENEKDPNAISWCKAIGSMGETISFKGEMSSCFWQYFLESGRKKLFEYNKMNKTKIKVVRGHTIKAGDLENL
ncbi:hypothetical protein OSTOST_04224, partial [Ostertagia ostertagi]